MQGASRSAGRQFSGLLSTFCRSSGSVSDNGLVGVARGLQTVAGSREGGLIQQLHSLRLWGARGMASYPPHTILDMPALSPTMSQGNIASWNKKEGEEIAAGDSIAEIETDKATMDWEAQDEGFLAKIILGEGTKDIAVGTPVAVVVEDEEHVGAFKDYSPDAAGAAANSGGGKDEPEEGSQEAEPAEEGGEEEEEVEESSGGGGNYPPHTLGGLPALSPTMSQGNIAKWNKKEGDEISAGDSIAEVETDKATMDWEAQDDGFVAKILAEEGAKDIAVGSPVIVIVEDQESVAAFKDFTMKDASGGEAKPKPKPKKAAPKPKPAEKEEAPKEPTSSVPPPQRSSGERVKASPYAKKLAREAGVDVGQATASGPQGRIVAADVLKLIESGEGKQKAAPKAKEGASLSDSATPSAPARAEGDGYTAYKDVPVAQIKKITAQRLLESKQTIPHYYLSVDCRVDKLIALRKQLNEALAAGQGGKLSVNDFVIKACAQALRKVPQVNASWRGEFIREFADINIGVAVQTEVGLLVPVLPNVDAKGLGDISKGVKALAGKARENKLKPTDFDSGTFTISNLGMFGIEQFAAIINPPQAAILAVGGTTKRVVVEGQGFAEASIMTVTLSCDHRVVDGALGAVWLKAFRANIEDPVTMLL